LAAVTNADTKLLKKPNTTTVSSVILSPVLIGTHLCCPRTRPHHPLLPILTMWQSTEESERVEANDAAEIADRDEMTETTHENTEHATEAGGGAVKTDIQCVEIDQCLVRAGCVRTLMMQTGAYTDSRRFDVIEQTVTPDGFEYVSTVFSDIQKAINHLRDAKDGGPVKTTRKFSDVESKHTDYDKNKAPRMSFKRCLIPVTHTAP